MIPQDAAKEFYNTLKPDDPKVVEAVKHFVKFPVAPFFSQVKHATWENIPSTYVKTALDDTLPVLQ